MKSLKKVLCFYFTIICICRGNPTIFNDGLKEMESENYERISEDAGAIKGFDANDADHWEKLTDMVQQSLAICYEGIDKASIKLEQLFDSFSGENLVSDTKGVGAGKLIFDVDTYEDCNSENEAILELEHVFQETASEIGDEQFSVLTDDPKLNSRYVKHAEKVLKAFEQACSSLPKVLPNANSRVSRSPEETMKRTVSSLNKWTERWVEHIETKFDKLIDICLTNKLCKPFLVKSLERFITHLQNENLNNEFVAASTNILQELVNEINIDRHPDPRSLSNVQKMALSDFFERFNTQEESAFNLATNIHDLDEEEPPEIFSDVVMSSILKLPRISLVDMSKAAELEVETDRAVHEVPDTFLSFGFDSSLVQKHWHGLKKKYAKLVSLVSALSPSILRVGGSDANFLIFDALHLAEHENEIEDNYLKNKFVYSEKHPKKRERNQELLESIKLSRTKIPSSLNHPKRKTEYQASLDQLQLTDGIHGQELNCKPHDWNNFTMTGDDMNFLIKLTHDIDWTLLFDLNQFWRDFNGEWDPTNAKDIMNALETNNIKVIYQLGNEPNAYTHSYNWTVSPEQAAKDYSRMKIVLRDINPNAKVVGPEITKPRHVSPIEGLTEDERIGQDSVKFLKEFLGKAGNSIDAITWHQYYINGRTATLQDFLSTEIMNLFPRQLEKIINLRDKIVPAKPVWLTETASAWGGGAHGLSNSFVGGFLWLDKLGAAALGGIEVVIRQTLYDGCYALLDHRLEPVPNYWVSLLHKKLVGQKVLLPRTRLVPESVRVYAHCLNNNHQLYKKGAVVIFGMNLSDKPQKFSIVGDEFRKSTIFKYDLTALNGDLVSRHIVLNGKLLELTIDGEIPDLIPTLEDNQGYLIFKPYSMQLAVLPEAYAKAC